MNISDINPYIRYVSNCTVTPITQAIKAYDCRLFYVMDGTSGVVISGISHKISAGTVIIIRPGTEYRFEDSSAIRILILNFDYTWASSPIDTPITPSPSRWFEESKITQLVIFKDFDLLNSPVIAADAVDMRVQLLRIAEEYENKRQYYREKSSAILKGVLIDMIRGSLRIGERQAGTVESLQRYLDDNYAEKITNKLLSDQFSYHEYHLNKLMLAHTGVTLHKYLMNRRLSAACRLLTDTELSISVIAEKVGFSCIEYFSNSFKKAYAVSPSEYRGQRKRFI